jgi:hypothetical protein
MTPCRSPVKEHLCRLAPDGWKEKYEITKKSQQEVIVEETPAVGTKQQKSAWAKLIKIHLFIL